MSKNLMTRQILSLALGLLFVFAIQACSSSGGNNGNVASTGTSGSIGVPECDEYITKYEACINEHVPEAQRAQLRAVFENTRRAWRDAAQTPQGRAGLAQGCKAALDAAKQQTAAYGCRW